MEPGGLWDADKLRIVARLVAAGRATVEVPLTYAGEESTFAGTLRPTEPGEFTLEVLAIDPAKANFGIVRRVVRVEHH